MSVIHLRRATFQDREDIYDWLANSDATPEMMGLPKFPDHPVPTYAEFCADYDEAVFDESSDCFQVFIISFNDEDIGAAQFFIKNRFSELDIWIAKRKYWGMGVGSQSLQQLANLLSLRGDVDTLVIRPSGRNTRAIACYRKAGFKDHDPSRHRLPPEFLHEGLDYEDAVILVWPLRSEPLPFGD